MKKLIIASLVLASFGVSAAKSSKMITVDTLQCENGMTASITDITTFANGISSDEVIAKLKDAKGNPICNIDSHDSDLIGFVELNDVNKTDVRSLMLIGKGQGYYGINWSSDKNNSLDASIRIQFESVVKCSLKEINSGI